MARSCRWLGGAVAVLVGLGAWAAEPAEEGRRRFLRGLAAVEMAKDDSDLAVAADEFRQAVTVDPALAGAWFNLGAVEVKLGRYEEAMADYRRYLEVAPQAEDAARVRDELVKIEFRLERRNAARSRAGRWVASDGTFYDLKVDGERIALHTDQRFVTEADVKSTYTIVGSVPVDQREVQDFKLTARGDKLQGTWHRGAIKADKCTIPEEGGEVEGRIDDRESRIVLRYNRSSYLARTNLSILSDDSCGEVTVTGKRDVDLELRGPLPGAGLAGVGFDIHDEPGRVFTLHGWKGFLTVTVVAEGSAAHQAGLREDDQVLAIDGAEVKTLSAGECLWRLNGKAGTVVSLRVKHDGAEEPVTMSVALEAPKGAEKR